MLTRVLARAAALPLVLGLTGPAAAQDVPADLAATATSTSPTLEGLRARESALRHRAEVAGAWLDPVVSVEFSNAPLPTLALGDSPMAGIQLRAQQTLRPPRVAALMREVGALRADAAGHAVAEAELQLGVTIEQTWWLVARSRMLRAVTEAHLARTEELLSAARSRYEVGALGQHAVLRLEVQRAKLDDDLGDFDRAERELLAALTEALGGQPAAVDSPEDLEPLPPPAAVDAVAIARDHRPLRAALAADQTAADAAAHLAAADAVPDLTLWAGYRLRAPTEMDPGADLVSVGASVPIPTGSARRAAGERDGWLQDARAAGFAADAAELAIAADAELVRAGWERAARKVATYDTSLIPGARATLDTTRAEFAVGRAEFSSLFEAEIALLDLERTRIIAAVETHLRRAEARAVLGVDAPEGAP